MKVNMKPVINKMHELTKALDIGLCFVLVGWLGWAVYQDKSALYLGLIVLSIGVNIAMILYQPSKRVTDALLTKSVRKKKV